MNKKTKSSLINIGTGKDYTIKQYVELFLKILAPDKKIKIKFEKSKPNGVPRKLMDVSLAKNYGWTYKTSIKDAVVKTFKDFSSSNKN